MSERRARQAEPMTKPVTGRIARFAEQKRESLEKVKAAGVAGSMGATGGACAGAGGSVGGSVGCAGQGVPAPKLASAGSKSGGSGGWK